MLPYSRHVLLLSVLALVLAVHLSSAQQCPEEQSWCQDRCGTSLDTCCDTPDGQHNLCGPGLSQLHQLFKEGGETDLLLISQRPFAAALDVAPIAPSLAMTTLAVRELTEW